MILERGEDGLRIIEGNTTFVLPIPKSEMPLEELIVRAALAVVCAAPESDGKARAQEIMTDTSADQLTLAMRICTEFLRG